MRTRTPTNKPTEAVLESLIPWVSFIAATYVAVGLTDLRSIDRNRPFHHLVTAAVVYLGFVAVPSLLPLLVAPPGWIRTTVLIIMTAVAVYAGVVVATMDDGQAGLAVLLVPYVAFPLAALLGVIRWIAQIRADRHDTNPAD